MAISFDNAATDVTASGNTSFSFTTGSGSNRLLLVFVMEFENVLSANVVVSYGGVNVPFIGQSTDTFTRVYGLAAPATGSNTLTVTRTVNAGSCFTTPQTYAGVAQTGFVDSSVFTGTGTGTAATATTTVVASNCWLVGAPRNGNAFTWVAGAGTTLRGSGVSNAGSADSNATVGTGSQSLAWTQSSSGSWSSIILSIKPSVAVAANGNFLTFM